MKAIQLTQGYCAIVDDEDYDELSKYNWYAHKNGNTHYATRSVGKKSGGRTTTSMHLTIMGTPKGMIIDHIDGNGLNNCKANLRVVTRRQNAQNMHIAKSSKHPGVHWHKRDGKWYARIRICGKNKHLGIFATETEAYEAYLAALKNLDETIITNIVPDCKHQEHEKIS